MNHRPTKAESDAAFKALIDQLTAWVIPDAAIDRAHEAARASLAEVKWLTEYEDGKASRLLTVVAFLSAVVGAVFTRFASEYPWPGIGGPYCSSGWLLPVATYAAFFVYVIIVTWSVLRVLGAIRPTFNIPATWKGAVQPGLPRSMLFYQGILDVPAPGWGQAFEQLTGTDGKDLKRYYTKCYIAESYLIAEKVATKLAVLSPGINALRWSMSILLGFFILFSATIITVDPVKTDSPSVHPTVIQTPISPPAVK